MMKVLIPVIALVVILGALITLEGLRVIDLIPSWPNEPAPTSTRDRDRDRDDDDDRISTPSPSPSPSPTPNTPAPTPAPTPPPAPELRGDGGSVRITSEVEFEFTPNRSGMWEFRTSDNGNTDPYIEIFDSWGGYLGYDDDSGDGFNAFLRVPLEAGQTYQISMGFWGDVANGCLLTVEPASTQTLARGGDVVTVNGVTEYLFTPDSSGQWTFVTSDNGGSDPYLELYDSRGNLIAHDDDSAGNYNARITAHLNAGETYMVTARFWSTGAGSYVLSVHPGGAGPGGASIAIPSYGGVFEINEASSIEFIPEYEGLWLFITSNNYGDPYLEIFDVYGNWVAEDDDSAGDRNAFIAIYLAESMSYTINTTFYGGGAGEYILSVLPTYFMPDRGGTLEIYQATGIVFTPDRSGTWEIQTSNNYGDPYLWVHDEYGYVIAYDDDSAGGENSRIILDMQAGSYYFINAGFYYGYGLEYGGHGEYVLTISRR